MNKIKRKTERLNLWRTPPQWQARLRLLVGVVVSFHATGFTALGAPYLLTNLGKPEGAYSAVGVRMNNLGHVAGWSQYFDQGEPSLRAWVWTPEDGFTVLPSPPETFLGRARAMDINDSGVVAGDGGFDTGPAWSYENGIYTIIAPVDGLPIRYLGGINEAGDIAGTAKDAQLITPDRAFLDINHGDLINLTPDFTGRATDVNNVGQVSGYANSLLAYRWDEIGGIQFLGTLGLAFSFGWAINDSGQVVGEALSATGNTSMPFIYTDGIGMRQIPAPVSQFSSASAINNEGHVVGTTDLTGGDLAWLWTGGTGVTDLNSLFDFELENVNLFTARDINEEGQILASGFDNNAVEFRTVVLTPSGLGVDCQDVRVFRSKCIGTGSIKVLLRMADQSFNGQQVTISIDGRLVDRTILNGAVRYVTPATSGPHTVSLENPPECFASINVNCP